MGMLEACGRGSYWKGLDYYEDQRVHGLRKINDGEFEAEVEGAKTYHVHLDVNHPRKSTCTCPHAAGRSVICKHKVAVYFSLFPEVAQEAIDERDRYLEEEEEREREYRKKVDEIAKSYQALVDRLPEEEVRRMLVNYMVEAYMGSHGDDRY